MTSEVRSSALDFINKTIDGCNNCIAVAVSLIVAQGAPNEVLAQVYERLHSVLEKLALHYQSKAKTCRLNILCDSLKLGRYGLGGSR